MEKVDTAFGIFVHRLGEVNLVIDGLLQTIEQHQIL